MARKKFQDLLLKNIRTGNGPTRSKQSSNWFRDNIVKISSNKQGSRIVEADSATIVRSWTNVGIGSMYFVHYDPKHKEKLKYYDNFPLVIPIERYQNGILGLNLHYLPHSLRAALLDSLMETVNNDALDETTKMRINYEKLASISRHKLFEPCIKRYLGKHFTSQFVKIHPSAWENAIYLPVEDFKKATKQEVWKDSRQAATGKKRRNEPKPTKYTSPKPRKED